MTAIDVSALEADLQAAPRGVPSGHRCALQVLVTEYPEAEEVLRRAIADLSRSAAVTAAILTRNGLKISDSSIKRHRQGTCTMCQKAGDQ